MVSVGELLALGGLASDADDGEQRLDRAIRSGEAAERFGEMVAAQGGPIDFTERWRDRLPAARHMVDLYPLEAGFVTAIDTVALGEAVVALGGGRVSDTDRINPAVGLAEIARIGARVDHERPLLQVHAAATDTVEAVSDALRAAFTLSDARPEPPSLVYGRIG